MSRITKEIATQVARDLTTKKREELKVLDTKFRSELKRMYVEDVPNEIKEISVKHRKYFDFRSRISLNGVNGFGYESYSIDGEVIVPTSGAYYTNISSDNAKILKKLENEFQDKKKELNELIKDLEILLYSLRTYSKVSEQFPEAIPFLPFRTTSALAINIQDLRNKL
jgi:hypothetical protein